MSYSHTLCELYTIVALTMIVWLSKDVNVL
jgi:hypothetical protein